MSTIGNVINSKKKTDKTKQKQSFQPFLSCDQLCDRALLRKSNFLIGKRGYARAGLPLLLKRVKLLVKWIVAGWDAA